MSIQVQGTGGVVAQVETNSGALRTVVRPNDVGALGAYSLGSVSGVMAAGLAAAAPIFAFRYGGANLALIKRVWLSAASIAAFTAAGVGTFNLFAARSFTASDTGGTSVLPTLNKLRTTMGTTGVSDIRISSTAALTAGTRTLDTQPISSVIGLNPAAASAIIVPQQTQLIDREDGGNQWPLILAQNEGFEIQATVGAGGTWTFSVHVLWEEVSAFGTGLAA